MRLKISNYNDRHKLIKGKNLDTIHLKVVMW